VAGEGKRRKMHIDRQFCWLNKSANCVHSVAWKAAMGSISYSMFSGIKSLKNRKGSISYSVLSHGKSFNWSLYTLSAADVIQLDVILGNYWYLISDYA